MGWLQLVCAVGVLMEQVECNTCWPSACVSKTSSAPDLAKRAPTVGRSPNNVSSFLVP